MKYQQNQMTLSPHVEQEVFLDKSMQYSVYMDASSKAGGWAKMVDVGV